MAPYLHALAHYDRADEAPLVDAVLHALTAPQDAPQLATFPPVRDVDAWEADLRERLDRLTEGALLAGDERIALDVYHVVPDDRINAVLADARAVAGCNGNVRKSVNALLRAIVDAGVAGSVDHARARLIEAVGPVCQQDSGDKLRPAVVLAADNALTFLRDYEPDERRAITLLRPEEEKLARVLINAYRPRYQALKANALVMQFAELDAALEDPDYVTLRDQLGLTDADVAYALWTLVDVRASGSER